MLPKFIEQLAEVVERCMDQKKEGGEYVAEDSSGNTWYLHVTPELEAATLYAYQCWSDYIQEQIEQLVGFVTPIYSEWDSDYVKIFAGIISKATASGAPMFELVVRVAEAFNARCLQAMAET